MHIAVPHLGWANLNRHRILLLYGSLRERSYWRLVKDETGRLLQYFGCETRIFDLSELPLPDQVEGDDHPAVAELKDERSQSCRLVRDPSRSTA